MRVTPSPSPPATFAIGLDAALIQRFTAVSTWCAWTAALIATFVLSGWAIGAAELIRFGTSLNGMAANTAVATLLLGVAMLQARRGNLVVARSCSLAVAVIAGATELQNLAGLDLGIDELLFRNIDDVVHGQHPGRMAELTAATLLMLSGSQLLIWIGSQRRWALFLSQLLAVAALAAGASRGVGLLYGSASLSAIVPFMSVAIPTSLCFLLLGVGMLCALPDRGLMRALTSAGPGGQLSRRSLPFIVAVPLIAGLLQVWAGRAGYVGMVSGVEGVVFGWIATFTALHFWNARALDAAHERGSKAEETRQRFFTLSLDMLCISSYDGYFKELSPAFTDTLGWSVEELKASPFIHFVHPDDVAATLAEVERQQQRGERVMRFENRYRHKNGSWRVLSWRSMPTPGGFMYATARDVTEQRQAEHAMQVLAKRLSLAADAATIGIWDWDVRTNEILWDERMHAMYGLAPGAPVNYEAWKKALHPDDVQAQEAALQKTVADKGRGRRVFRILRDGEVRHIHADEAVLLDDKGEVASVVGINIDITDRTLAEEHLRNARDEAIRAARAKSEFVANMSHEIRTPMNGVLGMTAALTDTPLTQRQREIADAIQFSAESLLNIINDILDFSKAEAGKMRLEQIELDAGEVVERAMEVMADRARNKQLELVCFLDPRLPRRLHGDPARLHQVLLNLLSNALKFTDRGEVALSVQIVDEGATELLLKFGVRDTGIGIPEATRRALFQPFTQADASTTRKYGGTGLGLVICKQLVELMGGEIGVESELGRGSTFWFTARLKKGDLRVADEPTTLHGARALLVDDNDTARSALAQRMAAWGIAVDQAANAAEALERIERAKSSANAYEFAVIDQRMPEVDGLELARRIQRRRERGLHVVLLQTERGVNRPEVLRDAGVSTLLTKPVRLSDFYNSLAVAKEGAPAPVQPTPDAPSSSAGDARSEAAVNNLRILVAEDNPVNQLVARHQLEKLGLRADFASNGHEAVEAHSRAPYDVILMDCQMPVMDGYLATAEIRRRASRQPWIVAMTAHAMPEDRQKCLSAGMDDYLSKPATASALRTALRRMEHHRVASSERKPPVNLQMLLETGNGDAAFVRELVDLFVSQTTQQMELLRAALARGRAGDIESIAHRCKGGSVSCGVEGLGALFKEIEFLANEGKVSEAGEAFIRAEAEFRRAREFLSRSLPAALPAVAA